MEKNLGKEYASRAEREEFLKNNCDRVEEKGYMKPFTSAQLQEHKENLAELSIKIEEVEDEKKATVRHFKTVLDPLYENRREMVSNIRKKAEYVRENCYKFTDFDAKETGYYNADGDLIECRPATADELQPTIFSMARKTGTDNQ
jgi:septation ring formation regulator EzrA